MIEIVLNILTSGIHEFVREGAAYLRYSIVISASMTCFFSFFTYYFPRLWNRTYHNAKLCALSSIMSFFINSTLIFVICILVFFNSYYAEQLLIHSRIDFSVSQLILFTTSCYLLLQGMILILLGLLSYKDIHVYR